MVYSRFLCNLEFLQNIYLIWGLEILSDLLTLLKYLCVIDNFCLSLSPNSELFQRKNIFFIFFQSMFYRLVDDGIENGNV